MEMASPPRSKQVLFFSHPRAACHLLGRMLFSKQPETHLHWHPFAIARSAQIKCFAESSVAVGMPNGIRLPYYAAIDQANALWEKALSEANATDETLIIHEHSFFGIDLQRGLQYVTNEWNTEDPTDNYARNFTLFPENLLLAPGTAVLLNIRHPALSGAGIYRGMTHLEHSMDKTNFLVARHLGWQRELYDWYVSHGITPVVVEAEDCMSSQEFVRLVARKLGLSPEDCVFRWEKVTEAEMEKMDSNYVKLQWTLLNSEGMVEKKVVRHVDMEVEEKKWREELGDDVAKLLKETTDASLPHYEYLRERKLRLED